MQYANSPAEVKKMCKLCAKETCIGPYNLGNWEDDNPLTTEELADIDLKQDEDQQYITKLKASLQNEKKADIDRGEPMVRSAR